MEKRYYVLWDNDELQGYTAESKAAAMKYDIIQHDKVNCSLLRQGTFCKKGKILREKC